MRSLQHSFLFRRRFSVQSYKFVRTEDAATFNAKELFEAKKPVIIKGLALDWPAVQSWRADYHKFENMEPNDDCMVRVEIGKNYMSKDVQVAEVDLRSFAQFCTASVEKPTSSATNIAARIFLAQCDLPESIKDDVVVPDMTKNTGKGHLYRMNMWMCGPQGSESPCHHDPFHNLLCQVFGTKRVVLFPPDEDMNLYPASPPQTNTSMVDIDDPNLVAHPDFAKARERGEQAILHRGDALYIPLGYWHYCKADSSSCSVNFWWL